MAGDPRPAAPVFRPVGDRAMLVEFGASIAPQAHAAVLALDDALADRPFPGLVETVPAFVNLLAVFDPLVTDHAAAEAALRDRLSAAPARARSPRLHMLGLCSDGADLAPDLPEVARAAGLSPDGVLEALTGATLEVGLYGFAPGYAYLSGLPPVLHLPRKQAPRRGVPAGSVIIAGGQCIVTTLTMPTGWWIIGRAPDRILTGDPARPFLLDVGDRVRFRPIPRAGLLHG